MFDAEQWTPTWVKDAVFYQIFPERFANGDPSLDPDNVQPWGTPPTLHNFMGGDLKGVLDHLDYLEDLGINAIYFNPLFQATSNHKYNTSDYFKIDPHFGDLNRFRELLDACHTRGIRVILDGVFCHTGRGFYAFHDVAENGHHSPYVRWFNIDHFPIHPHDESRPANYRAWWGIRSLPQLNIWHPPVREYLLSVARYWIELGVDGWRLDVPNEIPDHVFWREFRRQVKAINPDVYIVGEIWQDGTPWLDGTQFDGVMNYVLRDMLVEYFAHRSIRADTFGHRLAGLLRHYQPSVTRSQLNLLGSHDTPRFMTLAGGDPCRLQLAWLFLNTFIGAPCLYYGDEIGMRGEGDPQCRACFPWDRSQWDSELHGFFKSIIAMRRSHAVLRDGDFRLLHADGATNLLAYARSSESSVAVVLLNNNDAPIKLASLAVNELGLADGVACRDLLGTQRRRVERGQLHDILLPPQGGVVLYADR